MKKKNTHKLDLITIAFNKRARYEFFIEKIFEAGIVLQGWEVKSLRAGKANISDSYIVLRKNEAYLFGSTFQPLPVASSHIVCDPKRNRKLLLNQRELDNLCYYINREGYTVIAMLLYWKKAWCKLQIGIARGKKLYDKRENIKKREWQLNKARVIKNIYR